MSTELIVALDVETLGQEEALLEELGGAVRFFKIGLQLFTAHGAASLDAARRRGARVFLDLKLHDIPQTVANAVAEAQKLGVESLSVHLSGGAAMLRAAAAVSPRPKLWGVTMLTSLADADAKLFHPDAELAAIVGRLARLGRDSGIDATICSPREVAGLRAALPAPCAFVTPGIRPTGAALNDQQRVMTPAEAARLGIDFIVVGRPITHARRPREAAQAVLSELKTAEASR